MRIPWDRAGGRSAGLVVLVPVLVLAPVARPASAAPPAPSAAPATAVAPLPGAEWNDPDGVNWSDAPSASRLAAEPRSVGRLLGRRGEPRDADDQPRAGGRLREWLRERRLARGANGAGTPEAAPTRPDGWPEPTRLIEQLGELSTAGGAPAAWATTTLGQLRAVLATAGPEDEAAEATLLTLGETVPAGMAVADTVEPALAAPTRRAALAVSRRVAVWRAATACRPILVATPETANEPAPGEALDGLVESLERFEASGAAADAALAGALLTRLTAAAPAAEPLRQAIDDHYRSPNVRIAVTRQFAERMLPEATVRTGPVEEFVLGRRVRGTSRVEQSTGVRFTPHTSAIRCDLLVEGEIASRTVTESGPVSLHSRARGSFTVLKPIQVSARGLTFGPAKGTASTRSQLADIETSFDAVPVMGPLVRGIARSQHDASREEARREVNDRIISRACREVDRTAEPRFAEVAQRVRERVWGPLVALGLEPTPVALETTPEQATARLRLAGRAQLAAHTPRPRAPQGALVSVQLHESVVNNACEGLGLAGRTFTVAELVALLQERLGLPPRPTDDLPDGVRVTFADEEPLRVDCRDGRVWVRVSLAALESGRRDWEHVVARVAYRPVTAGLQVLLERDGPVQISGPGHLGRMEIGLRTVFGKVFAKERPIALVPETILANPRLADVEAVQAVSADGWLALALAEGGPDEAEVRPVATARRLDGGGLLRR